MKTLSQNRYTGWLIVVTLVAAFMLPQLMGRGMFFDGITYSTISRNLAEGRGTFWNPSYTETLYPVFHEHPPLVFGIQSLFFTAFGDHYYTEKIYTFFTFLLSALLIVNIWRIFEKRNAWLPVLLWLSCQVVTWGYVSNMQENTMGVFCLLAVWAYLRSFQAESKSYAWQILAGISVAAAMMCKGPVGAFPLAVPGIYWLCTRRVSFGQSIIYTLMALAILGCIFAGFWQIPAARANFSDFISTQLLPALSGKREHIEGSRLFIVFQLFRQLAVPVGVALLLYIIGRKRTTIDLDSRSNALMYFVIGLSASLPVMISLKQSTIYVLPAIPFFALAIGTLALPYLRIWWKDDIGNKWFLSANTLLFVTTLVFVAYSITRIDRKVRDFEVQQMLDDSRYTLPTNETVSVPDELNDAWQLQAYLMRFYHISIDSRNKDRACFFTTKEFMNKVPAGYVHLYGSKYEELIMYKKGN